MVRVERMSATDLRELCIERDWFTAGTCEEYDMLFGMAADFNTHDNENDRIWKLISMATWIRLHSTVSSLCGYELSDIMNALQACIVTYYEEVL